VLLTLSYAAVGYFEYLFYFWIHHYFDDVVKVSKNESRLYSTIVTLSMAAGMVLGGFLADALSRRWGVRRGRAAVVVGGLLAGALLLVPAVLVKEPLAIVALLSLAVAAVGATEGPFWATAIDMGGRRGGGTSAGIFNTGGNVGGQLAPILTPIISNARSLGWPWGIGLGGIVCLIGAVLWIWIDPGQRAAEQTADAEGEK
jgi:MFS family permease